MQQREGVEYHFTNGVICFSCPVTIIIHAEVVETRIILGGICVVPVVFVLKPVETRIRVCGQSNREYTSNKRRTICDWEFRLNRIDPDPVNVLLEDLL